MALKTPKKIAHRIREMKNLPGSWDRFRRAKGASENAGTATTAPNSS
jgi:hypothetical protein